MAVCQFGWIQDDLCVKGPFLSLVEGSQGNLDAGLRRKQTSEAPIQSSELKRKQHRDTARQSDSRDCQALTEDKGHFARKAARKRTTAAGLKVT